MRRNNNNKRKGQITVFILLGILILMSVAFLYYFINSSRQPEVQEEYVALEFMPIKDYVQNCISEVTVPGIFLLSRNGGYIYTFDNKLVSDYEEIAYSYNYENSHYPDKAFMQQELSRYIAQALPICLRNFDSFQGYEFEPGNVSSQVTISDESVKVVIDYPIKIKIKDSVSTISKFSYDAPLRLGHMLAIKDDIVNRYNSNNKIDMEYLAGKDVFVSVSVYDKNNVVFTLIDPNSTVKDSRLIYNFAMKKEYFANDAPVIADIPIQTAYVNEPFHYKVTASDPNSDKISFSDESPIFNINPGTGEIEFMPTLNDIGNYSISIIANDGKDQSSKTMKMSVTRR